MQKEGIPFKRSTPYSQEQNDIFERIKRIIMDITRAILLKDNINDNLYKKQPPNKSFQVSQPSQNTLSKTAQP